MKLVTFRKNGEADDRVGAWQGDSILEFAGADGRARWPAMLDLIKAGPDAWAEARDMADQGLGTRHTMVDVSLRAPIPVPEQFRDAMCFHKHIRQAFTAVARMQAAASGNAEQVAAAEKAAQAFQIPDIHFRQPIYYKGNRFAIGHPGQDIIWPDYSSLMDFELELACVIGTGGKNISAENAADHIFGYTIFNDFSARDAQAAEMDGRLGPAKGKDFDNANVFGPCIVTADEIGNPLNLKMTARVNGEVWGEGNAADMHWTFADVIAHISSGETLHPGEMIGSGTVGDGCGLEHMRFLNPGDLVELEIEKIGVLANRVVRSGN